MASGNDMKAHSGTYSSFIAKLKWMVPLLAIITLVVIMIISE
ncbi:aa3-type cytochrome c oxidase subunit IV [Altererythrobacter sp. MF3-039]